MDKKCDIIVDLQFGSTGKGLIVGFLAERDGYDTVVTCNMPNAGHTYISQRGDKYIHKALPNGVVSPKIKNVMIGPGAVFDPERMEQELNDAEFMLQKPLKLMIHPNATVLQSWHKEHEGQTLSGISSTMQGSMAAQVHKMSRQVDNNPTAAASDNYFVKSHVCTHAQWRQALEEAESILAEGSQGYSLGINTSFYPYCTSRDCTPARFLSDMAIPHGMLRKVIGTARTYPIRVGNTPDGYSGDIYPDQRELSWEELGQTPELTTVTKRVRRVFSFSLEQVREAAFYCCPDEIFLNFVNYCDPEEVGAMISDIENATGCEVRYLGYGPAYEDVCDLYDIQD